jgi:hypothetical protein
LTCVNSAAPSSCFPRDTHTKPVFPPVLAGREHYACVISSRPRKRRA